MMALSLFLKWSLGLVLLLVLLVAAWLEWRFWRDERDENQWPDDEADDDWF